MRDRQASARAQRTQGRRAELFRVPVVDAPGVMLSVEWRAARSAQDHNGKPATDPMPGLYFLELPPVIDAGRSERAAPVTMSATALAATSVRSFVALATWSPASFAASRALATCGLSDLLTRAAAAALAAATSALAKISRPRSELTRLSSAFVSVLGTVTPITLVGAEALVLAAFVFVARFFEGALTARLFDVVERVFAERVLAAFAIRVILLRLIVPHPGRHRVKLSVAG